MEWKIQLFKLDFGEEEINAVTEVARGGWLTMGERTVEFEKRFSSFIGGNSQAFAVSSGTAALHMAILALGIGSGDEVIVSGLTFIADVNVVIMAGATPVIADCTSYENWNIDPKDVERKITKKTKAVIAVHYAGYPCAMDELMAVCRKNRIALVEDSAHTIGASYKGRLCGSIGDVGCFSFFTNKNLSVGEGGMFVTGSEELARKGKLLRSHGMSTLTLDRHEGRAISYDVLMPGLNYRIDEFRAALGIIQLDRLTDMNRRRKSIAELYTVLLRNISGISIPFQNQTDCEPCYHIYPILLDQGIDRLKVIARLRDAGIQSSIHYPPIQRFSAFRDTNLGSTPIANDISARELTLPMYPSMTKEEVTYVAKSLENALK